MMKTSPQHFADLLTEAIYTIKAKSGKSIGIIQDEVGYALGREGGSFIAFLRKGNVPADHQDTEQLVFELSQREGIEKPHCLEMLIAAGHPSAKAVLDGWFGPEINVPSRPRVVELAPFVVGPPIKHPQQFYGRTEELTRIFNLWQGLPLQHMAVIGARRSGKTSLLYHVMQIPTANSTERRPDQRSDWLPDAEQVRWIYVDFQNPHMRRQETLLRHLARGMGLHLPEPATLELFIHAAMEHTLMQRAIIVIDELGAGMVAPELDVEFWWGMRSLLNAPTSEQLAFLVAAHQPPAALADEEGQTSPFFNMFNTLELGPLAEIDAQRLMDASPIPIPEEERVWIVRESGCMPNQLQIL
ncbi:MAG: hypothetical protein KDE53_15140 [Caldilineaceae bacterium]|nr:hypothetical protein [Caldilineaceae bacterium]